MSNLIIPKDYHPELNLHDTQIAIKTVKDFFQTLLAERLHLTRVSAPLFVDPGSGLNDNLNGVERPVSFGIKEQNEKEAEMARQKLNDSTKSIMGGNTKPVRNAPCPCGSGKKYKDCCGKSGPKSGILAKHKES
ncbi:SEC-C metal-binding domain-containing protein [Helicobacter rodentium]|uniref:SEC-C metal-binding domain-containing protein n=1 Tax=Helicobacter rodentium TaxID=59617 RepID=UPI003F4AC71A